MSFKFLPKKFSLYVRICLKVPRYWLQFLSHTNILNTLTGFKYHFNIHISISITLTSSYHIQNIKLKLILIYFLLFKYNFLFINILLFKLIFSRNVSVAKINFWYKKYVIVCKRKKFIAWAISRYTIFIGFSG